jgi:hypothetical protein
MKAPKLKWRMRYTSEGTFLVVFNDGSLGGFHYPSIDAFLKRSGAFNVI